MRACSTVSSSFGGIRTVAALLLVLCLGCLVACRSREARAARAAARSVLVLPARDAVQDGVPNDTTAGTGKLLTDSVVTRLGSADFQATACDDPAFTHTDVASREAATAAAQARSTTYCLQMVLGECVDAAPFTSKSDSVTLQSAEMWDVRSGETVWRLAKPETLQKRNAGDHLALLPQLGANVQKWISRAVR